MGSEMCIRDSYNGAVRPAVVATRVGHTKPMLRRETIEDLLSLEVD